MTRALTGTLLTRRNHFTKWAIMLLRGEGNIMRGHIKPKKKGKKTLQSDCAVEFFICNAGAAT